MLLSSAIIHLFEHRWIVFAAGINFIPPVPHATWFKRFSIHLPCIAFDRLINETSTSSALYDYEMQTLCFIISDDFVREL